MTEREEGIRGEVGEVVEVRGNIARVKIEGKKACAHCGVCTRISDNEMTVEAYADEPVKKGDRVVLSMGNGMILKSAFIVYMVPLIALIAGYYLGKELMGLLNYGGKSELFPALSGFFLLFLSFMAIRWFDRRKRDDKQYRVSIKKIPS